MLSKTGVRVVSLVALCVASSCPIDAEPTPLILDLQTGLALVQKNNERLLQARIDRLRGREELRVARAAGLPQVDASFTYNRNWLLPSFVFAGNVVKIGTENNLTGVVNVRQPLYGGGGLRATKDMAQRQLAMLGETERQTTQLVVAEVEERFYDLLLAEELRTVSHLALAWARRNLSQVEAQAQAGRAAELDQLRAQVQVSNMRADSISAENNLRLATMALKDVVGLDLDRAIEVQGTFRTDTTLELDNLDALVALGLAKRPELAHVEQEIGWHERKVAADQASSRPKVDLVAAGQTQFQSDEFDLVEREWRKSWNTGLVVQIPLFDGRLTGARVAQARQDLRRIEYDHQRIARAVRLQIQQAYYAVEEASERIGAHRDAVLQAEKGLEVAELRYASGVGTQLENMDAQLALVEARTQSAVARRDKALALMRLEQTVGVLGED